MKSRTTKRYRAAFRALPRSVQSDADVAYRRFMRNPFHPSLPYWSARVGLNHRVVGVRDKDEIVWFWIGTHAEYDSLIARL